MFFQDAALSYSKPKIIKSGGWLQDGTPRKKRLSTGEKYAPVIVEQSDLKQGNVRPFYTRSSRRNRRQQPFIFWLAVTSVFVIGYFLGHHHQPSVSQPGLQSASLVFPTVNTDEMQHMSLAALSSSTVGIPEVGMVLLPGRSFLMGDGTDGSKDARLHKVNLHPFMMAKHEVTLALWDSVMLWARDHGYPDLPPGNGKAHDHPVHGLSWGDAVKWCNALSEKEGLTPCYYTETSKQIVARKGMADIGNHQVNWEANGYRLPTEAEWEFAARGGLTDKRFPWGDEITHEQANYHGSSIIEYDKSQHKGTATGLMSSLPFTSVVGSFRPNGFGLYDMAGNVAEWCWDFYDLSYGTPVPLLNNPHGPDKGEECVIRGGSWRHTASEARCSNRFYQLGDLPTSFIGFRMVRAVSEVDQRRKWP